jgi:8-oxo-dGTP diphosphatase
VTNTPEFPRVARPAWNQECWFIPATSHSCPLHGPFPAVLVIAFSGAGIVLADIVGRGLTTPSGRVEPGETPDQAAVRETYEETGGHILPGSLKFIGYHAYSFLKGDDQDETFLCPVFLTEIERFDPIPPGSESTGIIVVDHIDLESHYFIWDELVRDLFDFAVAERSSGAHHGAV